MALYRIRLIQDQLNNIPANRALMTWGIEAAGDPTTADLNAIDAAWAAALNTQFAGGTLRALLATGLNPILWEAYPAAGGAAVAAVGASAASRVGTGGNGMASEVSIVCSQLINTTRGTRPIGRTYYGPFGSAVGSSSTGRPQSTAITKILGVAAALHAAFVARGWTPCVINKAGTVKRGDILGYQCDDAYDIQRSRGFDPTVYTIINV